MDRARAEQPASGRRSSQRRARHSEAAVPRAIHSSSIETLANSLQKPTPEPGRARAHMRKRRAVTNHIGTVHAIAMANLCELVAGTATEVSVPGSMRWIPRSMKIDYLAKAETDLTGEATLPPFTEGEAQDIAVPVSVTDRSGKAVVRAEITMYLSPKQA